MRKAFWLSGALGATLAINAMPAMAQDNAIGFGADEIIVTARSAGESLMRVPVSVSAISQADLARYQSSDLGKIVQLNPQVEIYGGGAGAGGAYLIRGIGTTADTAGIDQSVSIAIDGTQIARPRTSYAAMFDLEQVEILKGPQALFFGKNSSGGVVSLKTASPTDELSGYVTGGYEFKARERYVEAAVSTPVTDTLGVRFAGRYSKLRGWVKNIGESRVDPMNPDVILPAPANRWGPGSESFGGRVTVQWQPTDRYSSTFKATYTDYSDDGTDSTQEALCAGERPTHLGLTDPLNDCRLDGVKASINLPPLYATGPYSDERWFTGVQFTDTSSTLLTWQQSLDLDTVTIHSNTAYSRLNYIGRGVQNQGMFAEFTGGTTERYRGWSQELRLVSDLEGPVNFTIGGYYEDTKNYFTATLFLYNFGPDAETGSYQSGAGEAWAYNETWSFFGQARLDITENIELAGGGRYTNTSKRASQGQPRYVHSAADFLLPEGTLLHSRLKEDNFSPEVTLSWYPDSDTTLYAAYKTGYKSGGIGLPAVVSVTDTAESVVFAPEKAKGGEIGYKGQLFDRRLRLSLTGYYYKFSGLQLTSFDPITAAYRIQNAADAEQKGVEAEFAFRATDSLTLRGALSYNDLSYNDFLNSACYANQTEAEGCVGGVQDLSGQRLHRAPKFSGSAGFSFDMPIGTDLMLGLNGDVKYNTAAYTSETQSPLSREGAYALVNAGVKIGTVEDGWELALIGRNLTNRRVIGFVQDRPGAVIPGRNELGVQGSRPREVALQGTLRF